MTRLAANYGAEVVAVSVKKKKKKKRKLKSENLKVAGRKSQPSYTNFDLQIRRTLGLLQTLGASLPLGTNHDALVYNK